MLYYEYSDTKNLIMAWIIDKWYLTFTPKVLSVGDDILGMEEYVTTLTKQHSKQHISHTTPTQSPQHHSNKGPLTIQ